MTTRHNIKGLEKMLTKMTRKNTFRGINKNELTKEIQQIVDGEASNLQRHAKKIQVEGIEYTAFASKVLNKYTNNTGAGNWRVLYNGSQLAYATHNKKGGYDIQYKSK